jgi:hypothetical protein
LRGFHSAIDAERRSLWIGLAGFVLMISGAVTFAQGLWALDHQEDAAAKASATQLSFANLEVWGWIALTWGVIAFVTSLAIFTRTLYGGSSEPVA